MWWFLAREVLRLRGSISRDMPWEVMPDLFFYRDPEEAEKEEKEKAEQQAMSLSKAPEFAAEKENWGGDEAVTDDWAAQSEPTDWAAQSAPAAPGVPGGDTWGG